jgi:hypothetical protein
MKIEVTHMLTNCFEVNSWTASSPDAVSHALRRQLAAAAAIWPELKNVQIVAGENPSKPPRKSSQAAKASA